MRLFVVALWVFASACVTTRPEALPCHDGDAARCLSFVAMLESAREREGELLEALERYCLEGSLESCQKRAALRRDSSLEQLCRDGLTEACPIPDEKRAPELLRADCEQGKPRACRVFFSRTLQTVEGRTAMSELPLSTLEAGCAQGVSEVCFVLSRRLVTSDAERSKKLAWRACLSGVEVSCLSSDVGAARCAQGNAAACRAFALEGDDVPEVKARKLGVLKQACAHGLVDACTDLVPGSSFAEVAQLACTDPRACRRLMGRADEGELLKLCRAPKGLIHDEACLSLAEGAYRESLAPEAVTWAREACAKAEGESKPEACLRWARVLASTRHYLESMRVRCAVETCDEKLPLAQVDACLAGAAGDGCARAGLWLSKQMLDSEADLTVHREVLRRACDAKEALSCLSAAELVNEVVPNQRMKFLERACQLKSNQGCEEFKRLSTEQKACAAGHCAEWVQTFSHDGSGLPPEFFSVLRETCKKGEKADCLAFYARSSLTQWLRACAEHDGFCFLEKKIDRPRLLATVTGCEAGKAVSCAELLTGLEPDGFIGGKRTFGARYLDRDDRDVTLRKWSGLACEAKSLMGCKIAAEVSPQNDAPEAYARGCEAGVADHCAEVALLTWQRENNAEGEVDRQSPTLVGARAKALKACEMGSARGCQTAADFVQSGIGGPADPLEAERLRLKSAD